jgi:toxin ParE1/3/4
VVAIRWSRAAVLDLQLIYDYVADASPANADAVIDRILRGVSVIADFPRSGRIVVGMPVAGLREVVAADYRVIYRLDGDRAEILAVVHGRRDLGRFLRRRRGGAL